MQISFDTTLVVIFDGKNKENFLELFAFNYFPTTIVINQNDFWSKINKASEYSFDYILTVDGHTQVFEGFISLFEKINDAEIVIGSRQGKSLISTLFNAAYLKLHLYKDWFSSTRLYRIETLQALNKFTYSEQLDRFQFELLAKATEIGASVAEVDIDQPLVKPELSIKDISKLWLSLLTDYKKSPSVIESEIY